MTTPTRERAKIRNPNYKRFYEFNAETSKICNGCVAKCGQKEWKEVNNGVLGLPVHTNWDAGNLDISLVYICESPSDRELSHGIPSVGRTGKGIYKTLFGESAPDEWLDTLDGTVYRTNIVRCQADSGLQKRVDTTIKNRRVREAFDFCKHHLFGEIDSILAAQDKDSCSTQFVIAAGKSFSKQHAIVRKKLEKTKEKYKKISISEDTHPSS